VVKEGIKLSKESVLKLSKNGDVSSVKISDLGVDAAAIASKTVKYADKLSDELKNVFNQLVTSGLKYDDLGTAIRLSDSKGNVIVELSNNQFIVKNWGAHNLGTVEKELDNGYWLVKNADGTYSIDLGFKEGRVLDAKEVNEYLIKAQHKDPSYGPFSEYKPDSEIKEIVLHKGDKIYFVENNVGRPGGYASKDKVTTLADFRDKLAVKEEWKPTSNIPTLREYEVLQDIRVRSGIVGPQNDNGTILFGGGHQYEIIITKDLGWWDNDWPDCLMRLSEQILK
ncbi:MAG: hypothetical protein IJ270_05605, partial [Paludibacteraceae bacterium]|nr:hypothetical protein [Paludibacteraceae bacterium]